MTPSEFRKDIVSGDWVLIAGGLKKKPIFFSVKKAKASKRDCPFEDLKKEKMIFLSDFVQVIHNKFPILSPHKVCPVPISDSSYQKMGGVGFQEVVVTRDHDRSLGSMRSEEISLVIEAYLERYWALAREKCIKYILIFHNHGPSAGATVAHPHSQISALPIIPPDVSRSLGGSEDYFRRHQECAHCALLKKEFRDKKRIIWKNKDFVAIAPYASHVSFETRIYPIKHSSNFEEIGEKEKESMAGMMQIVFRKIKNGMNNPDYNFFIHTAPTRDRNIRHYHWHMEILPRTNIWGGLELGSGIEVIKIPPEESAKILRKEKI